MVIQLLIISYTTWYLAGGSKQYLPGILDNVSTIRGEVPETCINPSHLPQLMAKTYLNTCVLATHESSVYVRDKARGPEFVSTTRGPRGTCYLVKGIYLSHLV